MAANRVIEYAEERGAPEIQNRLQHASLRYLEFREALITVVAGDDGSADSLL